MLNNHFQNIRLEHFFDLGGDESSESETDNNEDSITCVKFLLLVDQLSIDQHHHLSIKDIGKICTPYFISIMHNYSIGDYCIQY